MDDVSFLKEIEEGLEEVSNARKVVGEWSFEITVPTIEETLLVKIKALVDSDGRYWAYPNILVNNYLAEGRATQLPEIAVSESLFLLINELKMRNNPKIEPNELY